ncbi:nuclear pore complex protein Nup54 [Anabrus simplex]|uniref:nuclear pore complex protein Nup54 n=1 Tax=Anabrus simplex TaxID=316456 RepID=UPI0035A31E62
MAFNLGGTSGFTSTTTTTPSFGFGANTNVSKAGGFGTSTGFAFGSQPSTFGSAPTATTASGFGGFGSSGGGGGFGFLPSSSTTATTSSTGMSSGFGGFGSFGTTTQPSTGTSLFPSSTGFGSFGGFGAKPAVTTTTGTFGGFGNMSFGTGFGQQQQQQLPQTMPESAPSPLEALYNAVFKCQVYGDERDTILARWNLLQALWGTGKGYYSQNAPPVEFTLQNPLCRFKAIGYSCIPSAENKDGLVAVIFNRKDSEIRTQQAQLISSLNTILGNKPNLTITVEVIKPMSENKTQVIIYVQEKGPTGQSKRIAATDLATYLLQPTQKQQLTSLGVENVYPQIKPDKDQLDEYLDKPPAGIDPRLWKQARLDNPNPKKYIPVPMVGFEEVRWRMKCQEHETQLHQAFLDQVSEDIANLQRQHSNTAAKIAEYRRRFVELEHRVLQVLVKQEISRKVGLALQPEEESLRSQLETLQMQINAPNQFKGRLGELLALMRCRSQESTEKDVERYSMDPAVQDDIKQFLIMEQNGMAHLIDTIQSDLASLKIMKDGMTSLLQGHQNV